MSCPALINVHNGGIADPLIVSWPARIGAEGEVRPMGRTAYGVKGITLEAGNEVIGMETITPDSTTSILTVTEGGYGKRTPVGEYRVQGRGGKGIISVKTTEKNGLAVGFLQVRDGDQIMLMAAQGKVLRCKVGDIREIGRNTQGVTVIRLSQGEKVVGMDRIANLPEAEDSVDFESTDEVSDEAVDENDSGD